MVGVGDLVQQRPYFIGRRCVTLEPSLQIVALDALDGEPSPMIAARAAQSHDARMDDRAQRLCLAANELLGARLDHDAPALLGVVGQRPVAR